MKECAVIVAGGSGTRMNHEIPKQFLNLGGKPVIWHSINAFIAYKPELYIILVIHPEWIEYWNTLSSELPLPRKLRVVAGGKTRAESVFKGLAEAENYEWTAVHDAVRPLIQPVLIQKLFREATKKGNAIPVIPVKDSLRFIRGKTSKAIDRSGLYQVQTPQVFRTKELILAFKTKGKEAYTDEATLAEKAGIEIHSIPGDPHNLKITVPADLALAELLLKSGSLKS